MKCGFLVLWGYALEGGEQGFRSFAIPWGVLFGRRFGRTCDSDPMPHVFALKMGGLPTDRSDSWEIPPTLGSESSEGFVSLSSQPFDAVRR